MRKPPGPDVSGPKLPTVPISEPELEVRFLEQVLDLADDRVCLFSVCAIKPTLDSVGLGVDDNGYITDEDNKLIEPAVFDETLFYESEDPADNPTRDYFRPQSEVEDYFFGNKGIHLSDLHSITFHNGTPYPVRDDIFNLNKFRGCTGMMFSVVTRWSSALLNVVDDIPLFVVAKPLKEHELDLSCLHCGETEDVSKWNISEDNPEDVCCKHCGENWIHGTVYHCTECGEVTPLGAYDDDDRSMYWEPYCKSCKAGVGFLDRYSYSSRLDEDENSTLSELQENV